MWSIEEVSPTVHTMRIDYIPNKDWEFRILLTADEHVDHQDSDVRLIKKHMAKALRLRYPNVKLGDFLCAMQGKNDPRRSRLALKERFNTKEEYFDTLVDYAEEFLLPYKDIYAMQVLGNHELSVLKHNETNLANRIVQRLRKQGSPVCLGGYQGYLKLVFSQKGGQRGKRVIIKYSHGKGGKAEVTRGVIDTNRRAVKFPDAHIMVSGHTHDAYVVPIAQERVSSKGKLRNMEQLHVSVPSYKDSVLDKTKGYEVEAEFGLKPVGAYWLEFWWDKDSEMIKYDARRVR